MLETGLHFCVKNSAGVGRCPAADRLQIAAAVKIRGTSTSIEGKFYLVGSTEGYNRSCCVRRNVWSVCRRHRANFQILHRAQTLH